MSWRLKDDLLPAFDSSLLPNDYVKAGIFVRKTSTQRNNIKKGYRQLDNSTTTLCLLSDTNLLYKLINEPGTETTTDTDWALVPFGQDGGVSPVGEWNPTTNTPTLSDANAVGRNGEFYFVVGAGTGYDYTDPLLFTGVTTNLLNGDWVISIGSRWTVVRTSTTWDAIVKPQSIVDYVNGIIIAHVHPMSDITGLLSALDDKYDLGDTADHTIDFATVPDQDIVEVEFLKEHYYLKTEVDNLVASMLGSIIPLDHQVLYRENGNWTTKYPEDILKTISYDTDGIATQFTVEGKIFAVYLGGQRLKKDTHYTVAGSILTMNGSAIPAGVGIDIDFFVRPGDWILQTGAWDDTGIWKDTATWID